MKHLLISRAFRRTGVSSVSLLPFLFLLITTFACNRMGGGKTSDDEDVRLFSLVADPSAEGDYATAIRRADSLLAGVAMGDTLKGYIMLERNTALVNSGNIVGSLTYTDTVLDFARSHGLLEVEIQILQNRGVAFRRIERYDSAINCYSRSIDLASAIGDIELMQSGSELLAVAYADMNRLEEAEDLGRKALDFATQMGDQDAMTASMSTLAGTLAKANKNIEAIEMVKPLLELQEVNPLNRVKLLTPLAYAATNLDSVGLMTEVVGEMKRVADAFPDSHQVKHVWLASESSLAAMKGDYRKQWEILCRLDSMPSQGKSAIEVDLEKAKCLSRLGRYNEAYDVLQKVAAEYEDNRQAHIQREMSEYFVKYQTLLKELRIVRLQNQRLILAIALGSCIFVIFGGWLLWIHMSRVRREREFHKAQMEFIRGLEHERGRVARELHDDVAGDLVGLQYDVLTNTPEESSEQIAAVAGKVRRLSHDMMPPEFEENDLPRLLEDLALTANAAGRVSVKTVVEGSYNWHSLDAKSNLNLYRIVQEVINNSVKYARNPEVEITLGGSDTFSLLIESVGVTVGKRNETPKKGIGHSIMIIRASLAGASIEVTKNGGKYIYNIEETK